MTILFKNYKNFVKKEDIAKELYGDNYEFYIPTITVTIYRLRKKLKDYLFIINRPNYGYCLNKDNDIKFDNNDLNLN